MIIFNIRHRLRMYVHIIGWCKIEMWDIWTEFLERIYFTVELALHEAFQGQHAGKIWVRVSVWQCRKWGLHGLYISRRKSSIADYWNYFMISENVHSFFFYWQWVLSTNNFLFLLITPVNSGSTKVNIKGVKKKKSQLMLDMTFWYCTGIL